MRKAINENRTVQLALLGALALLGGLFMLSMKGGKKEAPLSPVEASQQAAADAAEAAGTAPPPTATASGDTSTASDAVPAGGATVDAAATTTGAAGSLPAAASVPAEMVPGPGLPRDMLVSYGRGETIVLLVVRAGGIDDRLVRNSVERLRSDSSLAVYVTTAKHIARYAWLTQGANVTQLPALVVLSPRELSGGTPKASVSYGFRGPPSVVQAVRDALYAGPEVTYHP